MGGTNAHVIVEQARRDWMRGAGVVLRGGGVVVPWVVSARSAEALAGQAGRLLAHVGADERLAVGRCGVVVGDDAVGV